MNGCRARARPHARRALACVTMKRSTAWPVATPKGASAAASCSCVSDKAHAHAHGELRASARLVHEARRRLVSSPRERPHSLRPRPRWTHPARPAAAGHVALLVPSPCRCSPSFASTPSPSRPCAGPTWLTVRHRPLPAGVSTRVAVAAPRPPAALSSPPSPAAAAAAVEAGGASSRRRSMRMLLGAVAAASAPPALGEADAAIRVTATKGGLQAELRQDELRLDERRNVLQAWLAHCVCGLGPGACGLA
jgi:hypothetical protein